MHDNRKIWLNGTLVPWNEVSVPLMSHSLTRGSAVFDVLGTHVGPKGVCTFRADEHLKRLFKTLDVLGMTINYSEDQLMQAFSEVTKANNMGRGLLKVFCYWGRETLIDLVLDEPMDVAVLALPECDELGLDNAVPITACMSRWNKLHPTTVPPEAKACAYYLNGYLARKDAKDRGYDVGFLSGTDGFLAEGSIESIFMVKDGELLTPSLGRILNGITRMSILEAAPAAGIITREVEMRPDFLYGADEIFTAFSGIKVWPVKKFEDMELPAPGPVTSKIMQTMQDITSFKDDRFSHWFQPLSLENV